MGVGVFFRVGGFFLFFFFFSSSSLWEMEWRFMVWGDDGGYVGYCGKEAVLTMFGWVDQGGSRGDYGCGA